MISFAATNDKNILNSLYQQIFKKDYPAHVGYVLFYEDKPIGIAKVNAHPDVSHISKVGVLIDYRKKGLGDFFTRSLMSVLVDVSKQIVVDYVSDYFLQFGFSKEGNSMVISSENIVFPAKCKK